MKYANKFMGFVVMIVVGAFMLNSTPASAADAGLYPKIMDYDVFKDFAVIPVRTDVLIIDSRPAKRRYNNGHIPGAISIPDSQFGKMTNLLPENKAKQLIFYCGGVKCKLSHKSAFKAEALGYTNIAVYAAGMPDWKKNGQLQSVSAEYVKKAIAKKSAIIFDARPLKRKYAKGHVPGALGMPTSQFDKMTDLLPADKAAELVFYCGGMKCKLSVKSAMKAKALGYTNVKVFQGGYPEWKGKFGPGAKGMDAFEMAPAGGIEAGGDGDTITVASFQAILKDKPDSIYIYDVRDPEEYARGTITGAKNLSVEDLEDDYAAMPKDKPIVFACSTGARAGEAYDIVKMLDEKREVYFLDATLEFHEDGKYDIVQN